jgi:hypothetical protein
MLTDRNNKVTIITPSKRSSPALMNQVSFVSLLLTKVKTPSSDISEQLPKHGHLQYRVELCELTEQMHSMQLQHQFTEVKEDSSPSLVNSDQLSTNEEVSPNQS